MHNRATHQATGLAAYLRHPASRLVAMVNYGPERAELPLLWRLCLTWVELGYPVTVLDAGTCESADNPGLEQLLEFPLAQQYGLQTESAWRVIPSALGCRALVEAGKSLIDIESLLVSLSPDDGVVIAYANTEILIPLLRASKVQPVLVASSAADSLLLSYAALKRMLNVKDLAPLVIDQSSASTAQRASPARSLVDCAKNHLNCVVKMAHLRYTLNDIPAAPDLQQLALRVLESAHTLSGRWSTLAHNGTKMGAGQIHRSH